MRKTVYENKSINGIVTPTPYGYIIHYYNGEVEEFRYIEGSKTYTTYHIFTVSDAGTVKNEPKQRILKPRWYKGEYCIRLFDKRGLPTYVSIARVAAIAFLGDMGEYYYVNHKNGDSRDNHIENLEWKPCCRYMGSEAYK